MHYGRRGERPYVVRVPAHLVGVIDQVPGVVIERGGDGEAYARCAWDVANIVAQMVGQRPLVPPVTDMRAAILSLPGLPRYLELGFKEKLRVYQREGAVFMALRGAALNCDPMRSGKSIQALAGSVLVGARRTLILCPAVATWVWADEIHKWLGDEALILYGRGGDYARRYCKNCRAKGRLPQSGDTSPVKYCPECKARNGSSYGYTIHDVNKLMSATDSYALSGTTDAIDKKTGEAKTRKFTKHVQFCPLPPLFTCTKHPEVSEKKQGSCKACMQEVHSAIDRANFVICGYDLLVSQTADDKAGREYVRGDLLGWQPVLAKHKFDLCVADESHLLRGFNRDRHRRGKTRRERAVQTAAKIPRVWGLTGTPVYGFVRDLWGQLDFITSGLFGKAFDFHESYCEGKRGEFGWEANGKSARADTELVNRLRELKIQRPRSFILAAMPPKLRHVEHIEAPHARPDKPLAGIDLFAAGFDFNNEVADLIMQNAAVKLPHIVDRVIAEMAEGMKVFVLAHRRKAAENLAKAIAEALEERDHVTRMRQVNAKLWFAHGEHDSKVRFDLAELYREHKGAAVFVSTIDAMQVAISLKGCTSVHFGDWHYMPAAMLQAEDRGFEPGTTGMTITYYTVTGSVDEHLEDLLMPKFEAQKAIVNEQGAHEMLTLLGPGEGVAKSALARMKALAGYEED